ncbi:fimbrial protein [Proteus sp. G2665]|uniref:Type 1 fimbrial protein n=2 Tax=Morganellaceae TaxID=1903414 RepID=A0ABS0VZE0_9GAMM|nr:fimbrial protein [Proteus penneri ATCC 35198]MBJ2116430.1 type 1 fimbrial protein [Proteus penneri]NBM13183.1 fimbrial protein [Proteus sp. G2670]NBM34360.1 fimbrial protein [Proteus sp. G2664]NBM67794.1 fimbrial protein [Proteus sp. G2663]NBM87967.1 fimbrial protein [Proteus sp. G2661]NBN03797.1 fimbrial protein [Proteus sp. G2665]
MKLLKNLNALLVIATLMVPGLSVADVLVEVSATMVTPACDIRSEDSSAPLKINFGTLNVDELYQSEVNHDFTLYLTGCDFNKTLALLLTPKGSSTLEYNGKKILGTSISGLGIDFKDITGGSIRPLDVGQTQRISPESVDAMQSRLNLRAQLVSAVPKSKLTLGAFSSTLTIAVTYF